MSEHPTRRTVLKGASGAAAGLGASTAGCLSLVSGGGGKQLTVSSKNFTEQFILSNISILMLKEAGHDVSSKTGLGGSPANFKALKSGDSDLYWEYTGTAWANVLDKDKRVSSPKKLYNKVDEAYNENYHIDWLKPAPFNNTYVIIANPDWAKKTGVKSLSDLAKYVKQGNTDIKIAMNPEIEQREDAWAGVPDTYGFVDAAQKLETVSMKLGLAYKAVKNGQVQLGFGFATNPKIEKYGLPVIEDDKNHFIIYNPAPNVRTEVLNDSVKETLNEPTPKLDTETMRNLNGLVSIEGKSPKAAARQFLTENGFL